MQRRNNVHTYCTRVGYLGACCAVIMAASQLVNCLQLPVSRPPRGAAGIARTAPPT